MENGNSVQHNWKIARFYRIQRMLGFFPISPLLQRFALGL
jgi:hypothetical protein